MAKKFRPYFTLAEMRVISAEITNHRLKRYIDKFIRDADDGYVEAQIEVKDSLEVRIGLTPAESDTKYEREQQRRYENDEMTKEEELTFETKLGVYNTTPGKLI